jgi:hypothetical protein
MYKQVLKKTGILLSALIAMMTAFSGYVYADTYIYCYQYCVDVCMAQGYCLLQDNTGVMYWIGPLFGYDALCC